MIVEWIGKSVRESYRYGSVLSASISSMVTASPGDWDRAYSLGQEQYYFSIDT